MWTYSVRRQYERLCCRYATDLTDAEFALIEPFLPPPRSGGRSRKTILRKVLNAILCLLRSGCQWRRMLICSPPYLTDYGYLRQILQLGI